jgi:hypothetical protein
MRTARLGRVWALVATCAIVAGCGSSNTASPTAKTTAAQPKGPPSCNDLPAPREYSVCVDKSGKRYAVADIGHEATLATLRIKVNHVSTVASFPSLLFGDPPVRARGRFVVVNVTVTNRLHNDEGDDFETVPAGQVVLLLRGKAYRTSANAEVKGDPHGFLAQSNYSLSANESATGDLVFDVPTSTVNDLLQHGVLVVSDFNWFPEDTGRVVLLKLA